MASTQDISRVLQSLLEIGHMEKDCFTLAKAKAKGGKGKRTGSLYESEANGPENTAVGGFALY